MDHEFPYQEFEENGVVVLRPEDLVAHPPECCGPLKMSLVQGERCPICGICAGEEPTIERILTMRKLWPTFPRGFYPNLT